MKHSELTKEYLELIKDHVEMLAKSITDNYCHLDEESKKDVYNALYEMRDNIDDVIGSIDFGDI